jgi:hypothetical protein
VVGLAETRGASHIRSMTEPDGGVRHLIERRLRPDRRRGLDRRFSGRRIRFQWVETERRRLHERRRAERRAGESRRRGPERNTGAGYITLPPS